MTDNLSYLSNAEPAFVEAMYSQYQADPESVDHSWRKFFEGFDFARTNYSEATVPAEGVLKEILVFNMINGYRMRGHLFTRTNPVRERRKYYPPLSLETFGLSDADLDTVFQTGSEVGLGPAKLRDIVELLDTTYCQSLGAEYMYVRSPRKVKWLQERMESTRNVPDFSLDDKKHILHKLNEAVVFESFLGKKYVGQKRFSLEGAETLIPALDAVIEDGADKGIQEFIIGMAHRGRLNVLVNTLGKTYDDVFAEFEGQVKESDVFDGDVKYHMGYSTTVTTENDKKVHLVLCPNPSHLESVDPVAEGMARAKIDRKYKGDFSKLAPILIHGDAALAGQGVVYEVVQMAQLDAYKTGGTIHIVINNQVGFTTNYLEARSATYCTDVAKTTLSPVFHVNGDDAEAVVNAVRLAMEYRQAFGSDVFIDLLCYRRHGHNEGDEPRFTQPTLYALIEKHPDPRKIYFEKLRQQGSVEATLAKQMEKSFKKMLQARLTEVKEKSSAVEYTFDDSIWKGVERGEDADWSKSINTGVAEKVLRPLAEKMIDIPADLDVYSKTRKIYDARKKMLNETDRLNWAMGEWMAYASLLAEGHGIRITGQDVERGTFAHRHAVIKVGNQEEDYTPLNHLQEKQGYFDIHNSHLSEYAVLGFEYGYSWSTPNSLVIWEAQFGDFANGAQIIIDQYISSAETKWQHMSGLIMLLPHGYEGMGPEHSSARMERYLELCAGPNMQVINPTTPANLFHSFRRQLKRNFRVPLIVFSPKSLLGLRECVSPFSDFTSGGFQEVIHDDYAKSSDVKRVVLCTGKVYYDLDAYRKQQERTDVALVRVEQINPLPIEQIRAVIGSYKKATDICWVQEEPENMGAWPFILRKLYKEFDIRPIARKETSSPATGYKKQHLREQHEIIESTFDLAHKSNGHVKKLVTKK